MRQFFIFQKRKKIKRLFNVLFGLIISFGQVLSQELVGNADVPGGFGYVGNAKIGYINRVEAIRMGLEVNDYLDDRLDPFRLAQALWVSNYHSDSVSKFEIHKKEGLVPFELLSTFTGVPEQKLAEWNPHWYNGYAVLNSSCYGFELPADSLLDSLIVKVKDYRLNQQIGYNDRKENSLRRFPDPSLYSPREYKVVSGDYLSRIASKFGVTIQDISKWNNLSNDIIYPGQVLIVWLRK